MIKNLRFEISFKNISELESKLQFCQMNRIHKINIPCKGVIKKELLNETIEYIGKNYKDLDVIYHYSLYHQYIKNRENSLLEFLKFINKLYFYKNNEILLVSGSNKKKNFEVLDVINSLSYEKNLKINIGVAYNPYLNNYFNNSEERQRLEEKVSSGLIKSIWLQFGTDINLLKKEISFLKQFLTNNNKQNIKIFGSLLIPSRQFIARFNFRPWRGVYISERYLYSLEEFNKFTNDLISFYLNNNICPIIETECSSLKKLKENYPLLKI